MENIIGMYKWWLDFINPTNTGLIGLLCIVIWILFAHIIGFLGAAIEYRLRTEIYCYRKESDYRPVDWVHSPKLKLGGLGYWIGAIMGFFLGPIIFAVLIGIAGMFRKKEEK